MEVRQPSKPPNKTYYEMLLSLKEKHLIEELREIKYGRALVIMENGEPDRFEDIRQTKKL